MAESASESANELCDPSNDDIYHQDYVIRAPKFVESVLVGGHILVIIFSLCGNTAALIIIVKSKAPKLSTKYFLACLAISDLLMTLSAPPTEIAKLLNDFYAWVMGKFLCVFIPCLQLIAATMSAFALMAIAVERNLLIVRAMNKNSARLSQVWDTWICPLISILILAVPVACGIPNLWMYKLQPYAAMPSDGSPCHIRYACTRTNFDHNNYIYYSVTGSTYFILLGCFIVCYASIYRFVKKYGNFQNKHCAQTPQSFSTRPCQSETEIATGAGAFSSSPQGAKLATAYRHRKTLRLILFLMLLHIVCRLPTWLYLVITNLFVKERLTPALFTTRECFHLFAAIISAVNPFLYVICNHSLRATKESFDGQRSKPCCVGACSGWNCRCNGLHFLCLCGKSRRKNDMGNDNSAPELIVHSAFSKTPKIYYIADTHNAIDSDHHRATQPTLTTQKFLVSD